MAVKWYCAQTQQFAEMTAEQHLKQQGFEPFLPLIESERTQKGRIVTTKRPWVRGYIFIPFDLADPNWPRINNTRGVTRLMPAWMERPSPVSQRAMQVLLDQCNGNLVKAIEVDRAMKTIWAGAKVHCEEGPFAGFDGTVELTDKKRVDVLFWIFGRETSVSFDRRKQPNALTVLE